LENNPQFDKAFPHIASYKEETSLNREGRRHNFFKSLFYKYRSKQEFDYQEVQKE
jgi:hypothetical protein